MFETINGFFNREDALIEDKLKMMIAMIAIVRCSPSIKYDSFGTLLLSMKDLEEANIFEEYDMLEKSVSVIMFESIIECYQEIIDIYKQEYDDLLSKNTQQFAKIINQLGKLMPLTDESSIFCFIDYIITLINNLGSRVGFILEEKTPAVDILIFYMHSSNKEIANKAKEALNAIKKH